MLPVYQIIIPTPYAVGPVNIYLIKSDPITLIDVGPDNSKAEKTLRSMLESLGVNIKDIERIIITHSHPDHCGLAAKIAAEANASILVHGFEQKNFMGEQNYFKDRMRFIIETGIPAEVMQKVIKEKNNLPPTLKNINTEAVLGNEILTFANGELHLLHLPGHSPGHLCLYDPNQKNFFSGDFLLPHITPNPFMEPDPEHPGQRLPALKQYLSGLDKVEKLDINFVLPGHGGVFNDCKSVIDTGRCHHKAQFNRIKEKLRANELNSYQISKDFYPNLKGWEIFLGLSEVQAHLDLLVEKQEISCFNKQGVNYYSNFGNGESNHI